MGPAVDRSANRAGEPAREDVNQLTALRLGVVQDGNLVEEHLLNHSGKITVGSDRDCTVWLPGRGLPASRTLFVRRRGKTSLRVEGRLDGRLCVDDDIIPLRDMLPASALRTGHELPLERIPRGKIWLDQGRVALLFQFVAPRPEPQLPASIKGGLFTGMDWMLACCLITMMMLNFGFLAYLRTVDLPVIMPATQLAPDFIDQMEAVYMPLPKIEPDVGENPIAIKEAKPLKTNGKNKSNATKDRRLGKTGPAKAAETAEQRRARLGKQISRYGIVAVLGVQSKDGGGTFVNMLRDGKPDEAIAKAMDGAAGMRTASNGPSALGRTRGNSGTCDKEDGCGVVDIDTLGRLTGPGTVQTGEVKERAPRPVVKPSEPPRVPTTMNSSTVYRIVKQGIKCIRAAYGGELKRDHNLEGKIEVCVDINAMGKVTEAFLATDSVGNDRLGARVKGCMSRLRFPPPDDGQTSEVCVPVLLRPSN